MKTLCTILCLAAVLGAGAHAQIGGGMKEADLLKQIDALPAPEPSASGKARKKDAGERDKSVPTEITCTVEATFDNRTRQAVFVGNVQVKDPQFTITCDKLTAILHESAAPGAEASPAPATRSGEKADSGLESAIAEGHVVIVQVKPDEKGGPPKRSVGKAQKAVYDAKTGDVVLTGWPEVQQGINTQVALAANTKMTLNRVGTMKTEGPSKSRLQEDSSGGAAAPPAKRP